MVDITNRPILEGDLMLEIYNNGKLVIPHVAHRGFTPLYVRTVCIFHGSTLTYKSRVKAKSVIIVTEEQFLGFVEKYVENKRDADNFNEERARGEYNKLIELSRELKAKR